MALSARGPEPAWSLLPSMSARSTTVVARRRVTTLRRQRHARGRAEADLRAQLDQPVVRAHELADDGEADARAAGRPRARAVAAPEAVEDMWQVVRTDPDAGVAHLDEAAAVLAAHVQLHPPARVGVAQRVRQEVVDDLLEPARVAAHRRGLAALGERDALGLEEPAVRRGAERADLGEVDRLAGDEQVGALGVGELRHVVDEAG